MKKTQIIINIFFFLCFVATGLGFYYFYSQVEKTSKTTPSQFLQRSLGEPTSVEKVEEETVEQPQVSCSDLCKSEIENVVAKAVATISATTTTIVQTTTPSTSTQTSYVPLGTTFATTSMDWVEVPDSGVYIDLINDYGANAKVSWEASLKVAHGNGKAYARIWDDTNKIAVDFSELTTTDNVNFEQETSKYLPFWRGRNLYKVQMKSLNSFEVTYSGGKIKISH